MDLMRFADGLRWFSATCLTVSVFCAILAWMDAGTGYLPARTPFIALTAFTVAMLACLALSFWIERRELRRRARERSGISSVSGVTGSP